MKKIHERFLSLFQRLILSFSCLFISAISIAKPPEPLAALATLQTKIFGMVKTSACKTVDRGPTVKLADIDGELNRTVDALLKSLKDQKGKKLQELFHPRLTRKPDSIGDKILATLRFSHKTPWQFSIYRVYGLQSENGDKLRLACDEDEIGVTSLYGYPLQFGVLIQIMSADELGRLYFPIVPLADKWVLGGVHVQQWTFKGKDYEKWANEGLTSLNQGKPIHAHMKLDVAQKMLFGGDFLDYPVKDEIIKTRDKSFTKDALKQAANKLLNSKNVKYIGTILGKDGVGILLREVIHQEFSKDTQKRCLAAGKSLIREKWLTLDLGGIKCEYIYPQEDENKEGGLGGIYYSQNEIRNAVL